MFSVMLNIYNINIAYNNLEIKKKINSNGVTLKLLYCNTAVCINGSAFTVDSHYNEGTM